MIDLTIREPGAYNIPNEAYHSQICDAPSISSTGLRKIRLESLAHYWETSDLNPDYKPEPKTPALQFGSAAHSLLLEGKLPETEFAIEPFKGPYNRNEDGWKAGEKQAWRDHQHANGLHVVSAGDLEVITDMAEMLGRHELVKAGLLKGHVERAVFTKRDGFWLKAKPDVMPHDTILTDYKTAADASLRAITRDIMDRGYHMQIALAIDVIREATGQVIEEASLLVQEKKPPYCVVNYPLSQHLINCGRLEYEWAFNKWKEAMERQEWPGYPDTDLYLPEWKQRQLEAEGLL